MSSGRPPLLWNMILCDLIYCYRCRMIVRIHFPNSTHVVCTECNLIMSVDQIIARSPQLCQWWGSFRVGRIDIARTTITPRTTTTTTNGQTPGARLPTPPQLPARVRFAIEFFRRLSSRGRPVSRVPPAAVPSAQAFPTVPVTAADLDWENGVMRSICWLENCEIDFQEGEEVKALPCGHVLFHNDCLVSWLNSNANCPHCGCELPLRWRVTLAGAGSGAGSSSSSSRHTGRVEEGRRNEEREPGRRRQGGTSDEGRQGGGPNDKRPRLG